MPPGFDGRPADAGQVVDLGGQGQTRPLVGPEKNGPCPADMVSIAGAFCIDRYEVSLVDATGQRELSPHFPPTRDLTANLWKRWQREAPRSRMALGRSLPVPFPPDFQVSEEFEPQAVSRAGVLPAGYLSQVTAERACRGAGKRLCTRGEWVRACRGQEDRRFPYGDTYRDGVCNVHRKTHPARLLHGNSSEYHLDPRLGLTADEDGPLLRRTGATPECASRWGSDAAFDMVGNLDEWVDEPGGTFLGGFYSRATREGCDSFIDVHAPSYLDYSLGTRCCGDL